MYIDEKGAEREKEGGKMWRGKVKGKQQKHLQGSRWAGCRHVPQLWVRGVKSPVSWQVGEGGFRLRGSCILDGYNQNIQKCGKGEGRGAER